MSARFYAGILFGGALLLGDRTAATAEPPARGVLVVAVGDTSAPAARPLAYDVYRDEALRPAADVDDATARVLAGETPAADAPKKIVELSELRASVARESTAGSDAAARRLLASIGRDKHAKIVVSVTMESGRPVAKVLRVETAAYEGLELGATVETDASGEKLYRWPGAVTALRPLVTAGSPPKAAAAPLRPSADRAPAGAPPKTSPAKKEDESRPAWASPWFWATLGGVAALGLGVFGIAKATESDVDVVRVRGRIAK